MAEKGSERTNGNKLTTVRLDSQRYDVPLDNESTDSGISGNRTSDHANAQADAKHRCCPIKSTAANFRTSSSSCADGLPRDTPSMQTSSRRLSRHEEKLVYSHSRTRAWLSTPHASETGMRCEQRDEEQQRLYRTVRGLGLDDSQGKANSTFLCNAAHEARPSGAEEKRRLELSGVGAWTANVSKRGC
jgi:hypothetical protein